MSILKAEGLTYIYGENTPFRKQAITNISFKVDKPERIAIIGHTGSGKSTLVQHLNGLIRPNSGSIYVDDVNIWAEPKKISNIRFKVGLVFQYPEYQLFDETVEKDIAFGPKNLGLSADEIRERILWASDTVGLKRKLLPKSPFDLSGGEKRRAAIAGVLAMKPSILILDEPTAGLDPKGRDRLLRAIKEYQIANKTTVILVSHSMEDVASFAERVIVMDHGTIVADGATAQVYSNTDMLNRLSLGVPCVSQIIDILRQNGFDLPDGILTVDQAAEAIASLKEKGAK